MVRTRVRTLVAVLGVLIAFAMTPRTALADTYFEYSGTPVQRFGWGSAPDLIDPNTVTGSTRNPTVQAPRGSLSQYFDPYNTTSGVEFSHEYDIFSLPSIDAAQTVSSTKLYIDTYYYAATGSLFSSPSPFTVTFPSSACVYQYSDSGGLVGGFSFGWYGFALDSVMGYVYDGTVGQYSWVDLTTSCRFPTVYSSNANIRALCVRSHLDTTMFTNGRKLAIGIDGLKLYYVRPDSSVIQNLNGDSGTPVSSTITSTTEQQTESINSTVTDTTEQQTDTLMDTDGSSDIVTTLTDGGLDGLLERLGFVGQTIQITHDFFETLRTANRNAFVHFPGVTVQGIVLIPEQDVGYNQGGLGSAIVDGYIRPFFTGMLCLVWVFGMKHVFEVQILGYQEDGESGLLL